MDKGERSRVYPFIIHILNERGKIGFNELYEMLQGPQVISAEPIDGEVQTHVIPAVRSTRTLSKILKDLYKLKVIEWDYLARKHVLSSPARRLGKALIGLNFEIIDFSIPTNDEALKELEEWQPQDKQFSLNEQKFYLVKVSLIRPNNCSVTTLTDNPPFYLKSALFEDMRVNGPSGLFPILIRPVEKGFFEIIDGNKRWDMARKLGWKWINAFVRPVDESEAKSLSYQCNMGRGSIDLFKEATLFEDERKSGLTLQQIAKKYYVTMDYVAKRVGLISDLKKKP